MKRRSILAALALCGLCSCARPPRAWRQEEFLVGLRGAPPAKAEHFAQVAKAGFGVLFDRLAPDALPLAQRFGLKLAVSRIGLETATFAAVEGRQRTSDHIGWSRRHPALWGYQLADDVREDDFAAIGQIGSFVRECDPAHPFFVGALAADAWVGAALRSGDYAGYLDRFVRAVRPAVLSVAPSPPREGDTGLYFETLEHARRAALDGGVPLAVTVETVGAKERRLLGEAELRRQVYAALAYGARGILWSSYGVRPEDGRPGLVAPDGTPSERLGWVAALNRDLRTLGAEMLRLRSRAVYHAGGPVPSGATALPARVLVGSVTGGAFVVGLFEGERGGRYVLLVNKATAKAATAKAVIQRVCREVAWLDALDGRWRPLPLAKEQSETAVEVPLAPGGGKLLRVE